MSESDRESAAERQGIQSVELAMRVLRALEDGGGPMPLSEIAERSGFQPNKAHRYLVSLVRSGLASKSPKTGRYDFGPAMRRLGAESLRRTNEVSVASEYSMRLRDDCGHSVNLSVWGEDGPMVVRWDYGAHVLPFNVRVGAKLPMLTSSGGLIFLAYLPESMSAAVLAADRARLSSDAFSDADIARSRQEVLRAGYAVTSGGIIPGVSSVAAPVFSSVDSLPLAITVVFPAEEVDKPEMERVTAKLLETARTISSELGVSMPKVS
ncbi:DNA-binding IclR family transcriptional regulator [Arthrobacter pascens]|uniref:IclR family transcriptional regulator n=1 Tax=Arthrobacter pascens TaxID=1677 RepID=UPI002786EAD1|nr:IclR family transcriptional regulator [Arthrobacter pascens]MDQ0632368.1 DNA-binding IclR family transcriptional regulator [Arthrobacter pascens]